MAKTKYAINEKNLTKGELRKLNALRKSIGEFAEEAFSKWHEHRQKQEPGETVDRNAQVIEQALNPHIKKIKIPRGHAYVVRRGRGRFVVELMELSG